MTLTELRTAFINCGAKDAINLDGGGSTQFYSPNGSCDTGRAVRGFIAVWIKKPVVKNSTASADIRTVKVSSKLRIRKTPSILGAVTGWLYNGNKVEVLEVKGSWCRIAQGWVSATYLKK